MTSQLSFPICRLLNKSISLLFEKSYISHIKKSLKIKHFLDYIYNNMIYFSPLGRNYEA